MHSCQRGATLVELLVAITLVGMVFAIAVTLFVFGQRTFALTLAQADLQTSLTAASESIVSKVRNAVDVSVSDDASGKGADCIYLGYSGGVSTLLYDKEGASGVPLVGTRVENVQFAQASSAGGCVLTIDLASSSKGRSSKLSTSAYLANIKEGAFSPDSGLYLRFTLP